jgi:hypothetical protein
MITQAVRIVAAAARQNISYRHWQLLSALSSASAGLSIHIFCRYVAHSSSLVICSTLLCLHHILCLLWAWRVPAAAISANTQDITRTVIATNKQVGYSYGQ